MGSPLCSLAFLTLPLLSPLPPLLLMPSLQRDTAYLKKRVAKKAAREAGGVDSNRPVLDATKGCGCPTHPSALVGSAARLRRTLLYLHPSRPVFISSRRACRSPQV